MILNKDELPCNCNVGEYEIGGHTIRDSILLEIEYLRDGTRIDKWMTLEQLSNIISPYIPEEHIKGELIPEATWHNLKSAYENDLSISRFCDGMISTYSGGEWYPTIVGYDTE